MKLHEFILDLIGPMMRPKPQCRRVLILEDNENEGDRMREVVKSCGYVPRWFNSQRDAERAMEDEDFICGFFDLRLRGGCGEEARKKFLRKFPRRPAIIFSGSREAIVEVVMSGTLVTAQWKGNDFQNPERTVRETLEAIESVSSPRWTSNEVLLLLLLFLTSNAGTAYLAWRIYGLIHP